MHEFRSEKTAPKDPALSSITAVSTASGAKRQAARAVVVASAVATARDLVNTPPSHLHPDEFAKRAKLLGTLAGLTRRGARREGAVQGRLWRDRRRQEGFGEPAAAGAADLQGQEVLKAKKVALIGKGITFDTGGIPSSRPLQMHHMTSDMAGAAAVVATMVLAADQQLPIDVIATVPMAENMPSATAQRPGDVLTQYGGITVEVLNTDAEGRLILADAIVRACEDNPDYLIETSTLTGAQTVALGARIPGVMGSESSATGWPRCPSGKARTVGPCRFPTN